MILKIEIVHTQALEMTDWRVSSEKGAVKILGLKCTTLEATMQSLGITQT